MKKSQFKLLSPLLSPLCLSLGAGYCDTHRRGLAGFVSLHNLNLKSHFKLLSPLLSPLCLSLGAEFNLLSLLCLIREPDAVTRLADD